MSSKLHWKPVNVRGATLSDDLKRRLRIRYGNPVSATMGITDIEYLSGLADAGTEDAAVLIDALEIHGEVEVSEDW